VPEATPAASPQQQLVLEPATKEVIAATPAPKRFVIPDGAIEDVKQPAASAPAAPAAPAQNKGAEAPPAEPEAKPEKEEVTPEVEAKREGRRFERRLDKAYRARAEAEARAKFLEEQLSKVQQPKPLEGEPKLEQFDYDPEKYAAAKAEHAKSQAAKEFETKQRDTAAKAEQTRLAADWAEKVEKALDKYEDFEEKVGTLDPANPIAASLMEAENGEEIAYHLATHPKEARRIAELPLRSQIREIGKLEAKLAQKPVEPKAPSKAPAPIAPLTGTAPTVTNEPTETDDIRDWIRKRNKQVHGRG
jgi:hypothetical protein